MRGGQRMTMMLVVVMEVAVVVGMMLVSCKCLHVHATSQSNLL